MKKTHRVVFVLGAGASAPYGFPSGLGLRDMIVSGRGDQDRLLARAGFDIGHAQALRRSLAQSGVDSIDQFLETRTDLVEVGKALIAMVLSQFESDATLHADQSSDGRWYHFLFNTYVDGLDLRNLPDPAHLSFITFNYDRSLEYWLIRAVMHRINLPDTQARKLLKSIKVVHLHGTLGGSPLTDSGAREYGSVEDSAELRKCVQSLRIVHEEHPDTAEWKLAHELLSLASHVVFLGFGYNRLNVKRLDLQQLCTSRITGGGELSADYADTDVTDSAKIIGTCYELSRGQVHQAVLPKFRGVATASDFPETCHVGALELLKEYPVLIQPS